MIVRVVCLPSWELVRELKSWKHVIRRERAAAWQERRGYVVKWEEGWRRAKIGKSQALKVQRPASSGVKHIERQFRRRHRSYGLKVWEVWGKNKAPLSSFEYSKPHEKVWKRFPVRICKLKRLKKVCFQVVDRDDDREETERQESDKVFGEVWRRHSQKLFEDWLSSSSSWVSRGQVTRGTRQRVATSSWGTVLMRLRIKHYSEQACNLKMCFNKNLLFGAGWLVRGSWLNPRRIRVQLKT